MVSPKYNFKEMDRFAKALKGFQSKRALSVGLIAALIEAQSFIADKHLSAPGRGRAGNKGPWIPNPYPHKLRTLTGFLRAQFMASRPRTRQQGKKIIGEISVSNVVYLPFHEFSVVRKFGHPRAPLQTGLERSMNKMRDKLASVYLSELKKAIKA